MTEKDEKPIGLSPLKRVGCTVRSATTRALLQHSDPAPGTVAYRLYRLLQRSDQAPGAHFSSASVSITWWYPQLCGRPSQSHQPEPPPVQLEVPSAHRGSPSKSMRPDSGRVEPKLEANSKFSEFSSYRNR